MDFEKLYKKVQDGTATEEEKRLVEEEIRKAKEVTDILEEKTDESAPETPVVSKTIDTEKFKDALSYFNFKQLIKTTVIIFIVIFAVSVVTLGSILGIAYYNANQNDNVTKEQAIDIAKNYIAEYAETSVDKLVLGEVDCDLDVKFNLTKSRYRYEIEISDKSGEYTVVVNSESGYAHIEDIDGRGRFEDRDRFDDYDRFDD